MSALIVTASALHLRAGPGTAHASLRTLPQGTRVERVGATDDGEWVYVREPAGWMGAGYLAPAPVEPSWMAVARRELGVAEIPGAKHNARVLEYHLATLLKATTDETPWCSAFACWCMEQIRIRSPRSAAARDWLRWGRELPAPEPGCVVVFKRGPNQTSGHVAFFVAREGSALRVLGGNQSNQVRESLYPVADVLGYRMPA